MGNIDVKVKKDSWDSISDTNPNSTSSKKYLYLKVFEFGNRSIHLCKEISTNLHGVMFIANRSLSESKDLPTTKGFEVRFDFFNSLKTDEVAVVIKLTGNEYTDAFIYLIDDIFGGFQGLRSEKEIVDYFFNRINVWTTFFDIANQKGMSDGYRRGLFAELYFLKNYLFPKFGPNSLKYWTGPDAAIHDFEFGKLAIEVKSSAGNKSTKVKISNERQLDDHGYEKLLLFQVSLSIRKNHRPNLVDMVKEVSELLSEDHSRMLEFQKLLLMYGYHPMHEEYYVTEGYHVDEENFYHVTEGFPRIIGGEVPDGVGAIKYSIDLSACVRFKLESASFDKIFDEVVSD